MAKTKNKVKHLTIKDLQRAGIRVTKGSEYGLEKLIARKPPSHVEVQKIFSRAGITLSKEILKMREER